MRYSLKKQEKTHFCMVSCLQAILKKYGFELTQEKISTETNCTEEGILKLTDVSKFLKNYNLSFIYYWWNEVPFKEYDFLLKNNEKDILVAIPNSNRFHVYLFEEFKNQELTVIDPENAEFKTINLYNLIKEMEKKGGGFGLVGRLF